jgi:isoquinoline 1-oxidoreductase subunit beta
MKRRTMLAISGGLVVGFMTGCAIPVIPKRPQAKSANAIGWVQYVDGRYLLWLPRAEMGQNIATALKQIACEELDIAWDQLDVQLPSTRDIDLVRATVGSESVKDYALPLAQASATLRDAILAGRQTGKLQVTERPVESLRSISRSTRAMKTDSNRWIGQRVELEQARDIVQGKPLYASDIRRPGMLFGRVLRAPAAPELASRLLHMNDSASRDVTGFVALVQHEWLTFGRSEGIGILARTPGALDRIEAALAIRWQVDGSVGSQDINATIDIDRQLGRGTLSNAIHKDRVDDDKPWDVNLRFDIPLAAHGAIEPRVAVADYDDGGALNLWVGSQDIFYIRDVVVKRLGLPPEKVTVHSCRIGGAFGGKTICTVELEAAILARAIRAPVKVQWSRGQEYRYGFHRPPSSHRIRIRLNNGRMETWWHAFMSSHILFTNAVVPPWMQRLTDLIGDNGVARGAALTYRVPHRRTEFSLARLPVFTGPWRGLGAGPNHLAIESAIDECARIAGVNPLQFRLDHLDNLRLVKVLERVASAAQWDSTTVIHNHTKPSHIKTGRGLASGIYKEMSYAAVVADVEVDINTGKVRVTRLVCVHDCGRIINPDQVRAQCEGNLVWCIGMVLHDKLPVADAGIAARTFADAPIPLLSDVPPIEIVLVDEGEVATGAGETAIVGAAAIANAIRNALDIRFTRFPILQDDVLTALRAATSQPKV